MSQLTAFATALANPIAPLPGDLETRSGVDPAARLAIHRRTVTHGWVSALAGSFPATRAAMDTGFAHQARAYLGAPVPRPALLRQFAAGFPDFIAARPDRRRPWLANLARVEWLRIDAFHAPDAAALDAEAYRPLLADPAALSSTKVVLHPACRWLHCDDDAGARWLAWQEGSHPDAETDPALPGGVLVSRPNHQVEVALIGAETLALLDGLAGGLSLAVALAASGSTPAQPLLDLVGRRLASSLFTCTD